MNQQDLDRLIEMKTAAEEAQARADKARIDFDRAIAYAQQDGKRGDQSTIAIVTNRSRETLRRAARRYYRSIIDRDDNGSAWISMPADTVHADAEYEIRDSDKVTVLARVPGALLIDLRKEQLASYLAADPGRTNVWRVDVSGLLAGTVGASK